MRFLIEKGARLYDGRNDDTIRTISMIVPRAMEGFRERLDSGITLVPRAMEGSRERLDSGITLVPRAMEGFRDRLDSGITLECGWPSKKIESGELIELDFTKIFDTQDEEDPENLQIFLLNELFRFRTSFKHLLEHPLCCAFLENKYQKFFKLYLFCIMLPHIIFSLIFSFYCGVMFGYLCAPNDKDNSWKWNEEVKCLETEGTAVSPTLSIMGVFGGGFSFFFFNI